TTDPSPPPMLVEAQDELVESVPERAPARSAPGATLAPLMTSRRAAAKPHRRAKRRPARHRGSRWVALSAAVALWAMGVAAFASAGDSGARRLRRIEPVCAELLAQSGAARESAPGDDTAETWDVSIDPALSERADPSPIPRVARLRDPGQRRRREH